VVRDYNGGLILKRNEVLDQARSQLVGEEKNHEPLLEKLFYAISPASMQSCLSSAVVLQLFRLARQAAANSPLPQERYGLWQSDVDGWSLLLVCAEENSCREVLEQALAQLPLDRLDLASTYVNDHGHWIMGYVYSGRHPSDVYRWRNAIKEGLDRWAGRLSCRQQLRINLTPERSSLDPRIGAHRRSGSLMKMLYDGLTRMGKSGSAQLAVAEHVAISRDLKTYTFLLRESYWSNGMPVTAYDFEYAWKKVIDPRSESRFGFLFFPIAGARDAYEERVGLDAVGIHAANSRKLIVTLDHPTAHFLELTAHWVYLPLCQKLDEISPNWTHARGQGYVSNGPFRLSASKLDGQLRLVKNMAHWEAASVRLEQIDVQMVEDAQVALDRMKMAEVDWVGDPISDLPAAQLQSLKREGLLETRPSLALHWYKTNTERWPFSSSKIRRAFAVGLNRRALIDQVLHGGEQPAFSIVPPSMSLLESQPFADGDVALARRLLAEGLAEAGCGAEGLGPIVLHHSELEGHNLVAQEAARQWRSVLGVQVRLEAVPWKNILEYTLRNDYQIAGATWYCYCNDPIYNLNHLRFKNRYLNATRWESSELQRLLDAADQTVDVAMRRRHLREAEELLVREMPIIPVYCYAYRFVRRTEVQGITVSPLGHLDFKWAYIN
jgi:oligopeptide transport system substrate-binding protein